MFYRRPGVACHVRAASKKKTIGEDRGSSSNGLGQEPSKFLMLVRFQLSSFTFSQGKWPIAFNFFHAVLHASHTYVIVPRDRAT
jgi:hypothetical protein